MRSGSSAEAKPQATKKVKLEGYASWGVPFGMQPAARGSVIPQREVDAEKNAYLSRISLSS